MNSWRSHAILALQIGGTLSLRDAVAADAIETSEDTSSPLVELVRAGTLSSEALAQALTVSSGRPRLRWNMLANQGLELVYSEHRVLCDRYRALPLLLKPGVSLALGMVDPSWTSAADAFEAHFGVPVRRFVISDTDYIHLTQPNGRPNPEDYFDYGETMDESIPTDVLDLFGAFKTHSHHLQPKAMDTGTSSESARNDKLQPLEVSEEGDAAEELNTSPITAAAISAATRDDATGRVGDGRRRDDDFGGETPRAPVRALRISKAFETDDYAPRDAIPALESLLDRMLDQPESEETWRDLFDAFSLIGCACMRGLYYEREMFLADVWIDGAEVSYRKWALLGQMLHRVFPHQTSSLHVLQLDPRHRDELNVSGFLGTNVLLCTTICEDGGVAYFGLVGLPGEWIREINGFMTRFARGKRFEHLLKYMNRSRACLIHVV